MEEFISPNGLNMVKGNLFNWQKKHAYRDNTGPIYYSVSIGPMSDMYTCNYLPEKKSLYISSMGYDNTFSIPFLCDMNMAEQIIVAFSEAKNFQAGPLYIKH